MGKRQTLNLLLEIFVPTILEINVFYNSAYSRVESDKSIFEKKNNNRAFTKFRAF